MREAVLSTNTPEGRLPFSKAVWAGDLLFISGQASIDATGAYIEDSFEAEFQRSMTNLAEILVAAGLTLDDVVQVNAYLGGESYRREFNDLYHGAFSAPYPARTTISCGIATLKFEIDAIAHHRRQDKADS